PKRQYLRQIVLEGFVNHSAAALIPFGLNPGARKAGYGFHPDVGGDFDRAAKRRAGKLGLFRIQRILIIGADGRDAEVARLGFGRRSFPRTVSSPCCPARPAPNESASIGWTENPGGGPIRGRRCSRR